MEDPFVEAADTDDGENEGMELDASKLELGNVETCSLQGGSSGPNHHQQAAKQLPASKKKKKQKMKPSQAAGQHQQQTDPRPLILFDMNGVLVKEGGVGRVNAPKRMRTGGLVVRPQVELLLSLMPRFRVGIFSSAQKFTVQKCIGMINQYLTSKRCPAQKAVLARGGVPLFEPVLYRKDCQPDKQWRHRSGGKEHDTVKPLAHNGLDLRRTVLVDNELHKAQRGEEANLILLPSWEKLPDKGVQLWRLLMSSLARLPQSTGDLRTHAKQINTLIQNTLSSRTPRSPAAASVEVPASAGNASGVAAGAAEAHVRDSHPRRAPSVEGQAAGPAETHTRELQPRRALLAEEEAADAAEDLPLALRFKGARGARGAQQGGPAGGAASSAIGGAGSRPAAVNVAAPASGAGRTPIKQPLGSRILLAGQAVPSWLASAHQPVDALHARRDAVGPLDPSVASWAAAASAPAKETDAWGADDRQPEACAASQATVGGGGKRLRPNNARDVAQGVAPSVDLEHYRHDVLAHQQADEEVDPDAFPRGRGRQGSGAAAGPSARGSSGVHAHSLQTPAPLAEGLRTAPAPALAPAPAPAAHGVGHKRGRTLPGAVPLYSGPQGGIPNHVASDAAHHASRRPPHLTSLHHEVLAFARRALPVQQDLDALAAVMAKVQQAAANLWPQAHAHLFGSQASGLALPGSDLDIVVLGVVRDLETPAQGFSTREKIQAVDCLRQLAKELRSMGVLKSKPEVIARAKVPIIKAWFVGQVEGATPLQIDISVGVANGAAAVYMVQQAVQELPPLRPLCLILKALLRETGLNEVFQGGLSSYSLVNMVIAHLQCEGWDASRTLRSAQTLLPGVQAGAGGPGTLAKENIEYLQSLRQASHDGYDLGLLLKGFLKRFGHTFQYQHEAVSITRGGVADKPWGWNQNGIMLLGVEDPQQVGRDIAAGSFNMHQVRQVFREALSALEDVSSTAHDGDRASMHAHASTSGNDGLHRHGQGHASGPTPVSDEEKWAAIQREGQTALADDEGDEEGAGGGMAVDGTANGAGVGAGDGERGAAESPSLLDHILNVKLALGRQVSAQQRQQAIPRLQQRQQWLQFQGRPTGLDLSRSPGRNKAKKDFKSKGKSTALEAKGTKHVTRKERKSQAQQHGQAGGSGPAQESGGARSGQLSKSQKAWKVLELQFGVSEGGLSHGDALRVTEQLRNGKVKLTKKQALLLSSQLKEAGVSLTKVERFKLGLENQKAPKDFKSPQGRRQHERQQGGVQKVKASKKAKGKGRGNGDPEGRDWHRSQTRGQGKPRGGWVAV